MNALSPSLIATISCLAVFFIMLAIIAFSRVFSPRKYNKEWFFDNWHDAIYSAVFKDKDVEVMALKMKINVSKYVSNCTLCNIPPNIKKLVVYRLCAIAVCLLSIIVSVIVKDMSVVFIGIYIALMFIFIPIYATETKVKKRKFQVADELPRFLDLLHTALVINIPTIQAIELTADSLSDTILGQDFKRAISDVKIGSKNWQEALNDMANEYDVEVLSDFILDLVNAYNNGASIADSVYRKSKEIKQSNLLTMKERASKLTSTIIFPVMVFKIMPIIVILIVPIIQQLSSSSFGL